jgi:hypothetical protein
LKLIQRTRETWQQFTRHRRLARWGWLWPTLVIAILAVPAAQPLMRSSVTCSHDGAFHLLRLVEGDHLIRHGHLYPRWAPDMAYGYGYPLFNFYAPLSFYLAEVLHLLGLSFVTTWNGTLALCLLTSGLFAYLLARDWMPEHGALVAAAAYMLAPYTFYDIYFRGNLAESMALTLLPLPLWAFGRLVRSEQARYLALASFSLGLLLLTHQVMTLLFGPVLVIYTLILWWRERRTTWHLLTVLTAGILALGLSAFFWMPAFLEKDTVHITRVFTSGGMDYRHNFLPLAELLSPPVPAPTDLMNPSPPRSLSAAALVLGLLGLLPLAAQSAYRFWRRFIEAFPIFARDVSAEVHLAWHLFTAGSEPPTPGRSKGGKDETNVLIFQSSYLPLVPPTSSRERGQLLLFAGGLGLCFMMLSPSLPLWERIPLLHFAQFPWRFLGPTSLVAALLAGNSLSLLPSVGRWRWLVVSATSVAVTLLLAASLGWLYPRDCGRPQANIAAILHFEQETGLVGTTAVGEYLPSYVQEMPDPNALAVMYETGGPIERLDPVSLPEGATVELAEYRLTSARLRIRSPEPFRAVYRAFYFPGWRVAVNGENVPVIITAPNGLISFDVPAGQAVVQIWFGTTALRVGGALLSYVALLTVLWLAWQGRRERGFVPASTLTAARWWQWLILAAFAGGLLWAKIAVIDVRETWFRPDTFDGQTIQKADVFLNICFDDELTLLGYNLPRRHVAAGQALSTELFWAAKERPSADYGFSVRLVDEQGLEWSPKGTWRPGGFHEFPKTQSWQPGEYARDMHLIDVLSGTPPGRYMLRVTAFERETLTGLDVLNDQGMPVGQSAAIAEVIVTRPNRPPTLDELDATFPFDELLGDLTLLGLSLGRLQATPGDPVHLTTFWRAERPPQGIYKVYADLVDEEGQPIATLTFLPGAPQHATHQWQAGEVVRDQQVWTIPLHTPPGLYAIHFRAQVGEGQSHGPVWLSGLKMEVVTVERQIDAPTIAHKIEANFGDRATLLGYNLSPTSPQPGETLQLTLYWRAEKEMNRSYKVFAHLLDSEGRISAQHDAVPADWTRPTTGWLPGEIVTDAHELTLDADAPPGEYLLEAGLYEEHSGTRLPLLDSAGRIMDERVVLETVRVRNAD